MHSDPGMQYTSNEQRRLIKATKFWGFYNRQRMHSSIGNRSHEEAEMQLMAA